VAYRFPHQSRLAHLIRFAAKIVVLGVLAAMSDEVDDAPGQDDQGRGQHAKTEQVPDDPFEVCIADPLG
jgi:hypothetical protein